MTAAARPVSTWARWEIVALLWFAYFLNQADRQIFGVTLPLIRAEFGLSDQQMGLVATTFTVVFGLLVPFAGLAGDRFNRRSIVVLSLLVFSIGTLLTGFAPGFLFLLLFRGVATGAGEALYAPAANALIADNHDETRSRALSIHQTANYTGVVLGSLFAGWVADHHGWRAAFAVFGAAGIAWALVILWRARSAPPPPRSEIAPPARLGESARYLLSSPSLIGQTLGFSGLVFVLVGYLTWMPTILYERFDMPLAAAGFYAVVFHHVLGYLGLLAAGFATDRMAVGRPRLRALSMALALIACGPFIWLAAEGQTPWLVYLALAGFGLFRGVYDANLYAAIFAEVDNRLRATVTGLIVAVAYVVGATAPLLMGILKASLGPQAGLTLLAAVAAATGSAFFALASAQKGKSAALRE